MTALSSRARACPERAAPAAQSGGRGRRLAVFVGLQAELLRIIQAWHERGTELSDERFNDLALKIFAHQLRYNKPYATYCARKGVTLERMPAAWEQIPAVPTAAYKEAALAAFDPRKAKLVFETSGTTRGIGGRHYMETAALYDAALLAGFDRFMLYDGARLRYLNLVPNPQERPQSSLGYMMARVAGERGAGDIGWYLRADAFAFDDLFGDIGDSIARGEAVCIAATAFALAALLDAAEERNLRFSLPAGSRIMETGGFKGRTRVIVREELYSRTSRCFGIDESCIVAEYGMTELTSQWYDLPRPEPVSSRARGAHEHRASRGAHPGIARLKSSPPWLRAYAAGPDGRPLPDGVVGALVHVDIANVSSCVALATEDLGATYGRHIVLLGREEGAGLRGCSLDAEMLARR